MAITLTTPTTAVVAVRIPHGSDGGLATDAERRLARLDGVRDVTVDELRGLQPRLSATVATVGVAIDSTVSDAELRDRFGASADVDAIERLDDARRPRPRDAGVAATFISRST